MRMHKEDLIALLAAILLTRRGYGEAPTYNTLNEAIDTATRLYAGTHVIP